MICPKCAREVRSLTGLYCDGKIRYHCKFCNSNYKSLPSLHNCDTFYSHYDSQLGQYFESKEQKKEFLKTNGLYQVSGTASPKHTEGRGRLVCTKDQYRARRNQI